MIMFQQDNQDNQILKDIIDVSRCSGCGCTPAEDCLCDSWMHNIASLDDFHPLPDPEKQDGSVAIRMAMETIVQRQQHAQSARHAKSWHEALGALREMNMYFINIMNMEADTDDGGLFGVRMDDCQDDKHRKEAYHLLGCEFVDTMCCAGKEGRDDVAWTAWKMMTSIWKMTMRFRHARTELDCEMLDMLQYGFHETLFSVHLPLRQRLAGDTSYMKACGIITWHLLHVSLLQQRKDYIMYLTQAPFMYFLRISCQQACGPVIKELHPMIIEGSAGAPLDDPCVSTAILNLCQITADSQLTWHLIHRLNNVMGTHKQERVKRLCKPAGPEEETTRTEMACYNVTKSLYDIHPGSLTMLGWHARRIPYFLWGAASGERRIAESERDAVLCTYLSCYLQPSPLDT